MCCIGDLPVREVLYFWSPGTTCYLINSGVSTVGRFEAIASHVKKVAKMPTGEPCCRYVQQGFFVWKLEVGL